VARIDCGHQVADVDGVKRAPEDPDTLNHLFLQLIPATSEDRLQRLYSTCHTRQGLPRLTL
jgi:hypothetical protein